MKKSSEFPQYYVIWKIIKKKVGNVGKIGFSFLNLHAENNICFKSWFYYKEYDNLLIF